MDDLTHTFSGVVHFSYTYNIDCMHANVQKKARNSKVGSFSAHLGRVLDVFGNHFRDFTKKVSPAAQYTSGGAFSSTFCVSARSRSGRTRQGRRSATTAARGNRGASSSSRCACRRGAKPREPCPHARTPDRVAANVPAVAGALFHKRSALKIDAVVEKNAIVHGYAAGKSYTLPFL